MFVRMADVDVDGMDCITTPHHPPSRGKKNAVNVTTPRRRVPNPEKIIQDVADVDTLLSPPPKSVSMSGDGVLLVAVCYRCIVLNA